MPAAIGIILNQDSSKVLLVKRRDVPIWVLPGGGIESGESPEEAIIREAEEETQVKVEVTRKVAEYIPVNRLASFTYLFECRVLSGTPEATDESEEAVFFPIDRLPENFFYIHQDFLNDALDKKPFVIQKFLNQVSYRELGKYFLKHPVQVLRFGLSRLGLPINK